jgi:hypothetical protein
MEKESKRVEQLWYIIVRSKLTTGISWNSRLTFPSRQQAADSRQQIADSRQQTTDSRLQTVDSRQQTAHYHWDFVEQSVDIPQARREMVELRHGQIALFRLGFRRFCLYCRFFRQWFFGSARCSLCVCVCVCVCVRVCVCVCV